MSEPPPNAPGARAATGIAGLDNVLCGGLTPHRFYLIEGTPGAGKTTLALQWLLEGVRHGERGLYVTLSETAEELRSVAASHGWSLDAVEICELVPSEESLTPDAQIAMFHLSEVELGETTRAVLAEVERVRPQRVVFDSLSELRLLAQNSLRYRRQILGLKQYFIGRHCTVLLLDDRSAEGLDTHLQSIAHGVLTLEQLAPEYGAERRRLRVLKLRGVRYRGGYHDFIIERGGLHVFPRLVAAEHREPFAPGLLPSGIAALDVLLGGGLSRGSSVLVIGPPGSGKTTIATQCAVAAAARGERAAMFAFEERRGTLLERAAGMRMGIEEQIAAGRVTLQQVDPAELSPGEFAHLIRQAVEPESGTGARIVVIDSLNGYLQAMPEERFLTVQLHELLTYLGQLGVVTLLVAAQRGMIGPRMESPVDATYLSDTEIMLRFFEAGGRLRRALSVVKKRAGPHEDTIHELRLTARGIEIGEALDEFHGILTGVPSYGGSPTVEDNGS